MSLKRDVDARRREISSDNLSMSIGELLNLYKDNELDIHPEFQRVFRWGIQQKSRLIESLLLGIPLPSLYVATNERGVWEVIDGVQRLSTIFEFMGELRGPADDESDELVLKPGLVLEATKHLPSLADVAFASMDNALRLEFKRTRMDIKVLGRDQAGKGSGKFDLFERLNTYGSPLSPQELRNCILVNLNSTMFRWLKSLAEDEHFRNCTLLSEAQLQEKYDMDLALRFIVLRNVAPGTLGDVHEFLRDRMEEIAQDPDFDMKAEGTIFRSVFKFIDESVNGNAFRPWSEHYGAFRGGFSLAAFEGLGLALGRHWSAIRKVQADFNVEPVLKSLWRTKAYNKSFSGLRARERMVRVVPDAELVVQKELERITRSRARRKATGNVAANVR